MAISKARRALNQRLKTYTQPSREIAAFMGDANGVVAVVGKPGYIYVRDIRGNVSVVWNTTVPNILNQPVFIAYLEGRLQVVRVRDVFFGSKPANVGPHNWTHEWTLSGGDVVRVFGMQIMPWRAYPNANDAFTVDVYRAVYDASGTWQVESIDSIDLTAHKPATSLNGCYVLLVIGADGVIDHVVGSNVDPYTNLAITDIPAIPSGHKPLWAIRLYNTQTELHQEPVDNDFTDLRDAQLGGGGGVGSGDVVGPSSAVNGHLALFDGTTGKLIKDGGSPTGGGDVYGDADAVAGHLAVWVSDGYHIEDGGAVPVVPSKATSSEIDTGTNDTKFVTPKGIADSHNVPNAVPGTSGNYMKSDGTDWISSAFPSIPVKATGAEIDTGTDDAKFATPKAIADSKIAKGPASAVNGHLVVFDGTSGKLLKDGGAPAGGGDVYGDASAVNNHIAVFNADGYHIKDGGVGGSGDVVGPASAVNNHVVFFDTTTGKLIKDSGLGLSGSNTGDQTLPVKATGAELDTGTDDAKFATAKALKDSHNVPSVVPGTAGNIMKSDGTDWISGAASGGGHTIQEEGSPLTQRSKLNFIGARVTASDDSVNDATKITIDDNNYLFIDQAGGTGDTYGVLGGTRNGSNKVFTVSQGAYNSGTLRVYLNGQLLTQGSGEDWVETTPASGTFTFDVAPLASDEITVVYGYESLGGGSGGPPGFQTLTDGANISWNLVLGSGRVTLAGNRTLDNPTNMADGEHYFLSVVQDGTGSRTLAYGTAYKFPNNIHPALSSYHDREDILVFECDGDYMFFTTIVNGVTNTDPTLGYLTNLVLWFKADAEAYVDNGSTLCVDNDTVYRWGDQSGNSYDAIQATSSYRPTYKTNILNSKPVVRFDGVDNVLPIPSDLAGTGDQLSFFIVIIPYDTAPIGIFDSGDEDSIRNYSTGQWDWFSGSPYVSMSLANTDPIILEFIHTMSPNRNIEFYKNGVWVSSNPTSDSSTTLWESLAALGSINFGYDYYQGDIAEFIMYKEALSTAHRQDAETYLKSKYGIT